MTRGFRSEATARRGVMAALLAAVFALSLAGTAVAEDITYRIARGGKLYDTWTKEADGWPPGKTHPKYPEEGKSTRSSWLCAECHGIDYGGNYDFKGIQGYAGKSTDEIIALLKGEPHGYNDQMFSEQDFQDVALFVSKGQVDMSRYIDGSGTIKAGDPAQGEAYYNGLCAACHGLDGKKESGMPALGKVVNEDPARALHVMINGRAGESMLALRSLPDNIPVDILAYATTLPH